MNVGEVDILIGLPTHNNAKTVGPILQCSQAGLVTRFPRESAAIINADGGSRDGTPELVAAQHRLMTCGIPPVCTPCAPSTR